ncbi:Mitochondrial copper homeostasis protein [Paraphaeosphaeria minitans]|uniref:Cytochrome c oxidase-assembly factor cox-23 n=1 Tax=Paraphaeosphaeria minitans TaxID=565426 RepID=A0A9P6KL94_9PLEO|nr:cytochrome c oxidase-assembly factor cox-23 [Paraphaeosphaeria minitans]
MSKKDAPTTSAPGDAPSTDNQWTGATATRFENKAYSEYFDPCQEAANKSIRCLNRNGGDREMCSDFFQAYRDCKEQWTAARKEARRKSSWFG